jgi:hypothetical protein
MPYRIRRVEYYHANVRDDLGSAYRVLHQVAGLGVDLFAFAAVPSGPDLAQLTLFPEDPGKLIADGRTAHPQSTVPTRLLVQGDDELGVLAPVHERLVGEGVDVYASTA